MKKLCVFFMLLLVTGCKTVGGGAPAGLVESDTLLGAQISKNTIDVVGQKNHYQFKNGDIADLQAFLKTPYAKHAFFNRVELSITGGQLVGAYILYIDPKKLNAKTNKALMENYGFAHTPELEVFLPKEIYPVAARDGVPTRTYYFDAQKTRLINAPEIVKNTVLVEKQQDVNIIDLDKQLQAQIPADKSESGAANAVKWIGVAAAVAATIWLLKQDVDNATK
ncbi:hypothetical protein VQ643_07635 [Pseudomonas sp. F1_0610]|uniref:hypothetical protein n=1 Tax=Pseudomonas sp. F1_0610 TaxID=3114284 RepID=UPI0039C37596